MKKAGLLASAALALTATFAEARCVTAVGGSDPSEVASDVAQMTENAHRWRTNPGGWRRPVNGRLLQVETDVAAARVGRFSFANAVRGCEQQHVRATQQYPGALVTTGLTCGDGPTVIQNSQSGLVCRR